MSDGVSDWLPIESAPKDGTEILAVVGRNVVVTRWELEPEVPAYDKPFWLDMSGFCGTYECFRTYDDDVEITHWMPLPEPPL